MTTAELTTKVNSIVNGMKAGEVKRFRSGVEVSKENYDEAMGFRYSVVSPDGQESVSGISKEKAIDFVLESYR